jgi:hypothetical protein
MPASTPMACPDGASQEPWLDNNLVLIIIIIIINNLKKVQIATPKSRISSMEMEMEMERKRREPRERGQHTHCCGTPRAEALAPVSAATHGDLEEGGQHGAGSCVLWA